MKHILLRALKKAQLYKHTPRLSVFLQRAGKF